MADFDIFISYRTDEDDGRPTRDAAMAESLYFALRRKGYNPFFSKHSISGGGRSNYMEAIYDAMETVTVFVAVGSSRKNLTSRWVQREIAMFSALMMRAEEGALSLLSYRSPDYPVDDLPASLVDYQSFADEAAVVRFIDACLQKATGFRNDGDHTMLLYDEDGATCLLTESSNTSAPAASKEEHLPTGTVIDGRYMILNMIGRGGMGYVHLAMDQLRHKTCAVKEIRRNRTASMPMLLQSIFHEANLMKNLDHPAFPKIYDIIDNPDSLLVIMEYVEGESLNHVLSRDNPQSEAQVLNLARQLGQAFDYLHNLPKPIIYRDLKPGNIMLQPDGKIKIIDFGAAREYKKTANEDTVCLGTIGYAAPEQFGGMGQSDMRTDIYNLGATLYHIATGKNPADPPYEILPIRQVNPDFSRGLELILQKCTQKDPTLRFQSAREFLDALDNIESLSAAPRFPSFSQGFAIPTPEPIINRRRPQPPLPMPPVTSSSNPHWDIYNAETEPLAPPPKPTPAPALKAKPRKVTVHSKATPSANREMEDVFAKLSALDPASQQIVRDLIDRLSK